jgi:acyl carrier protein
MTELELKQTIFQLLKKIAPDTTPEELSPQDNIRQKLDIDSYDYLQFIIALDKTLGIQIPELDYGKINTLEQLLNYVKSKIS